jgi:hypothetical protein
VDIRAEVSATVDAAAKAAAAEATAKSLQESNETQLNARLQEQPEALETDTTTAINAEKPATFEGRQKLANKVDELQRSPLRRRPPMSSAKAPKSICTKR